MPKRNLLKIYFILTILCLATPMLVEASQLESMVQGSGSQATTTDYQLKPVIGESAIGRSSSSSKTIILGFLAEQTSFFTPVLSISVNPKLWDMGSTEVNQVVTMTESNKITVTNDGNVLETFELSLINPSGWTHSTVPEQETYVLSGLFCGLNDIPQANNFNQDASTEDVITTTSKRATTTTFAYAQATANGISVPSGATRALYLQFKSPTITNKQNQQDISVIVSSQVP